MPFLVTMGMGASLLGAAPFDVTAVTPGAAYLDLTFDSAVAPLQLQAADPAYWTFFTSGPIQIHATSLLVVGSVVRIFHTEPKAGDTYILTMPLNGLKSVLTAIYNGSSTQSFVAVAASPIAAQAQSIDERHVRVIYSEPVITADALTATNYSITPPLDVVSVSQETQTTYVLTTGPQVQGTVYTINIVNVRDLSENPV
jgi:hypothetical protein